ncbi:MAG: cytochrome c, partial [Verrucomicrobiota bacterium]
YDPEHTDAKVRLFAAGLRNVYDLVQHPNGHLYGATNMNDVRAQTGSCKGVPNLIDIRPPEYLAWIRKGRNYGFPNPSRGECVLLGGNPTRKKDPWEISRYPVGIKPHPQFDPTLLHRIDDIGGGSANGIIAYRSPGELQHRLIQCFYERNGQGRFWTFTLASDGRVQSREKLKRSNGADVVLQNALDLCEHPSGHLFVAKYGQQRANGVDGEVWMLRRAGAQQPAVARQPGKTSGDVLFVTGNQQLDKNDRIVKTLLESKGLNVTLGDNPDLAERHLLTLISSSVSSSKIGDRYRDVRTPVIVWEDHLFDDMGMAESPSEKTSTFTYSAGAAMPGLTAPARRVGFFPHDGEDLFLDQVKWALGGNTRNASTMTALKEVARGGTIYRQQCIACHGADGEGQAEANTDRLAPPLGGSPRVVGPDHELIRILLHGLTGPIDGKTYSGVMAPFPIVDDRSLAAVASYIRGAWGNRAGIISPHEIS